MTRQQELFLAHPARLPFGDLVTFSIPTNRKQALQPVMLRQLPEVPQMKIGGPAPRVLMEPKLDSSSGVEV